MTDGVVKNGGETEATSSDDGLLLYSAREAATRELADRIQLALRHAKDGNHADAETELRKVIAIDPLFPIAQHNLAVALAEQGKREEALSFFLKAIELDRNYFDAHRNLAATLIGMGKRQEAINPLREALRLQPMKAELHNDLGFLLTDLERPSEAAVYLRQAVRLKPDFALAWNNLGIALVKQGKFDESHAAYEKALSLDPGMVDAHIGLGSVMGHQCRPAESAACFDIAIWLSPDSAGAHFNRGLSLLHLGDFERGWAEYEWRWKRKMSPMRPFKQPMWDGSSLEGKRILLHMEQGMGDCIQFVRYVPMVKAKGAASVILECREPVLRLLGGFEGVDQLAPEGKALPEFDVHASVMSLPCLFKTTLQTIPNKVPYLHPEKRLVDNWRRHFAGRPQFNVGIIWQGNPNHKWDRYRSVPLSHFEPIANVPNVKLFSLQRQKGDEQLNNPHLGFKVHRLLDPNEHDRNAWPATGAIMANLDLVIGVDTASIHLAGALGVPVWVAIAKGCDWRWLLEREDSPWYPTMRLFRQQELNVWKHVFEQMAKEINPLAQAKLMRQENAAA